MIHNDDCPMCAAGVESVEHLFFECSFAKEVLAVVLQRMKLKTEVAIRRRS